LEDFRLDHVAALYLAGRADEATKAFERLPYTKEMRSLWDCVGRERSGARSKNPDRCTETDSDVSRKWRLIESSLNRRDEDPYLLIEGNPTVDFRSALWMETTRRRLTGDNYESVRRRLAESWVRQSLSPQSPDGIAMVSRFMDGSVRQTAAGTNSESALRLPQWNVAASLEPVERGRPAATPRHCHADSGSFLCRRNCGRPAMGKRYRAVGRTEWPNCRIPSLRFASNAGHRSRLQ